MLRKVYDEPNPFLPEVKRKRKKDEQPATAAAGLSSAASSSEAQFHLRAVTSKSRAIPPEKRLKLNLRGVDAYTRHKMMINNYVTYYKGSTKKLERDTSNDKNDYDIIRENHRFLWSTSELTEAEQNWEANLAKRYYDKLFKEYCIIDLSKYEKNMYAMRWRVEREVISGKGQFECGSKHCQERQALSSWEVQINFTYIEHGVKKNALVKVRLCPECSAKLNFHSQKRLIKKKIKEEVKDEEKEERKRKRKERKREKRRQRKKEESSSSSTSSESEDDEDKEEQKVTEEEKRKIDEAKGREQSATAPEIWSQKTAVVEAEKTVNDEFDEFIDDLLL